MAILCCASPSKAFVEETRSTLKFAAQARLVAMKPKVNEVLDDGATIKKLQNELVEALRQIEEMKKAQLLLAASPTVAEETMVSTFCDSSTNDSLGYENTGDGSAGASGGIDSQYQRYEQSIRQPLSPQVGQNGDHSDYENVSPSGRGGRRPLMTPNSHEYSLEMNDIFRSKLEHTADTSSSMEEPMQDSAGSGFPDDAVDSELANNPVKGYSKGDMNSVDPTYYLNNVSVDSAAFASELERLESPSRSKGSGIYHRSGPTNNKFSHTPPRQEYPMPGVGRGGYDNSFYSPGKKTLQTEDGSVDGPEASYGDASLKFSSQVSTPVTIRGDGSVVVRGERSQLGSTDYDDGFGINRQLGSDDVSWDTMNLNTTRPEEVGQPLQALESLTMRDAPIPDEVIVISSVGPTGKATVCLSDQLKDAKLRIQFLERQLESSDNLVEATFKDLERARRCIHDLVSRNVEMRGALQEKKRDATKEEYMVGEVMVEQYWILKGSIYVSLFFFLSGGYEYFLASAFFVWLALETTMIS
jgi:hypothetical protein